MHPPMTGDVSISFSIKIHRKYQRLFFEIVKAPWQGTSLILIRMIGNRHRLVLFQFVGAPRPTRLIAGYYNVCTNYLVT